MNFYKQLILEVVKLVLTFGFGILSFRIFERYKNKKENNKLYISLLKIEKELLKNKEIIDELINYHISIDVLLEYFNIDKKFNVSLYNLYKDILNLSNYRWVDYERDENGNKIDRIEYYDDKPYEVIEQIEYDLAQCEDSSYIEVLEKQLKYYENHDIYTEFERIYKEIEMLIQSESEMKKGLIFLKGKLEIYNKLLPKQKKNYLQKFCELIFEENNDFTESLNIYREIEKRKFSLNSKNAKLNFDEWNSIDVNILALYDAESYINIEDIYKEISNFKIDIKDIKSLEKLNSIIDKLLKEILKHENRLKKILIKNNRYFKYV